MPMTRAHQVREYFLPVLNWLHHRRMLFQFDMCGRGTFAVLRNGCSLGIAHPPRHDSRIWEMERGITVESSEIYAIQDQSAYGYNSH